MAGAALQMQRLANQAAEIAHLAIEDGDVALTKAALLAQNAASQAQQPAGWRLSHPRRLFGAGL